MGRVVEVSWEEKMYPIVRAELAKYAMKYRSPRFTLSLNRFVKHTRLRNYVPLLSNGMYHPYTVSKLRPLLIKAADEIGLSIVSMEKKRRKWILVFMKPSSGLNQ